MTNRHIEGCSMSLIIRKMQIITTMRCHLTPARTATINKSTMFAINKQVLVRMWRKGNPHCWWECGLVQPLWKTVWGFFKKLKMELPFNPASLLLGIYLKKPETLMRKNTCTPMFIVALFIIAKIWKQPK